MKLETKKQQKNNQGSFGKLEEGGREEEVEEEVKNDNQLWSIRLEGKKNGNKATPKYDTNDALYQNNTKKAIQ